MRVALLFLLFACGALSARAAEFTPYFVSLKGNTAYMREGPGNDHRIKWVYHRKGLPLEVLATYDVWRRVRDMDGEVGWIHMALLSRDRMAVVMGEDAVPVHRRASEEAGTIAKAEPGAIGRLAHCGPVFCEVRFEGASGFIERDRLFGVRDGEQF